MHIIPLSEGVFTIGHDKVFVPFDVNEHQLHHRPVGSLLVEIQPFVVIVNNQTILFDTGLGFTLPDGELQLHANLAHVGLSPSDIDKVILSHLHKDHAGGITYTDALGIEQLSFPKATYYIGQQEFDFAVSKGAPSYIVEDFLMLKNNPQVEWLSEEGNIEGFIQFHTSGGHCPYHQCFLIDDGKEKVFFGGDVAPQFKQLKTRYIAKYDYDGKRSMEMRQHYAHQGKEEGWKFLFYHDVQLPVGQF